MRKISGRILTAFLVLGVALTATSFFPGGYALAEGENQPPLLVIGKDADLPVLTAGEPNTLVIPVQNRGGGEANNVMVSLVVDDPATFPFVIDRMTPRVNGPVISGGGAWGYIHYNDLMVAPHAESKIYTLGVLIEYKTEYSVSSSASGNIFVQVVNDKAAPAIRLTGLQWNDGQAKPASGSEGTLQLRLRNEGNSDAHEVEVQLSGFSPDGFNLKQELAAWKAAALKSREVVFVPYKLSLHENMVTASYSLNVRITFKDAARKEYSVEETVYIEVEGDGSGSQSKTEPKLIISAYDYGGAPVFAGNAFPLSLTFHNTHADKEVVNVKVSLSSDDNVFTPVGSTNTFYLPAVAPGATADYQVRLQPRISADTRTYSLNATLEYEDEKGNKYTASQIVGVPVVQELKLTVADIQVPVQVFLFDRLTVSVDYYNMGRALVRNLMITTEGNFEITNGSRYIGNMEPGKSNYFDVMLTPSQLGRASGRVIFTFEDEIGNRYEQSRSFAFDVAERVEEENPDQFAPEAPSETNGSKLPLVGGAGVLLLLGGIFWLRRRRRKKAEEELAFDE